MRLNQSDANDDNDMHNTGHVMWPSAVLLAHYLSKNPSVVYGKDETPGDILELGSGCGLAGLTAATLLQNNSNNDDKVIFTDYNEDCLKLLEKNICLNEFDTDHKVIGLDWFDQQPVDNDVEEEKKDVTREENTWLGMDGLGHEQVRLILGADLLVCSNDADLVAGTIDNVLMEGGRAIIVGPDEWTRFGVRNFPEACRSLGLKVSVDEDMLEANENESEQDDSQQQLMNELELGGFNQRSSTSDHDFTMFTIDKPITSA